MLIGCWLSEKLLLSHTQQLHPQAWLSRTAQHYIWTQFSELHVEKTETRGLGRN